MAAWRRKRRRQAHFLHIGKTAGTAIKAALRPVAEAADYQVLLHGHETTLTDVPEGDKFFFVVRDPVDRFVSAFYSRQRQGRPRYDSPWTEAEARAFGRFDTANELALALSAAGADRRRHAHQAMRDIEHVRDSYWRWFESEKAFLRRRKDLLYVGRFHRLGDGDFAEMARRLGLHEAPVLPADDISAHRNPAHVDRRLAEAGRHNLQHWYASDYAFVALSERACSQRDLLGRQGPRASSRDPPS